MTTIKPLHLACSSPTKLDGQVIQYTKDLYGLLPIPGLSTNRWTSTSKFSLSMLLWCECISFIEETATHFLIKFSIIERDLRL